MGKLLGIALCAGVTSAVLFAVITTASPAAILLVGLAPLPIMIAGLGFAPPVGAAAALIGGSAVGLAMRPIAGLVFLVALGIPAWHLSRLAVSARPGAAEASAVWYPIASLLLHLAAAAAVPVLLIGALLIWDLGGYDATVDTLAQQLDGLLSQRGLPVSLTASDFVRLMPVLVTGWSAVMLSVNLWLAARSVQISGLLKRPWPNLPDALRLPRSAVAGLAALAAAAFLPDPWGLAAAVATAALTILFVFEGLAAAHVLTRGLSARIMALSAIYLACALLTPWPLLALALLGCIDCLAPALRRGAGLRITKLPTRRQ